jgi:hypothetical protein
MIRRDLLVIGCLLSACGATRPPAAEPAPTIPVADAVSVVRNGGDPVSSLRATFTARMSRGDASQSARGVLLVQRPDRVRLRISSPLGLTILDYTSDRGSDRLWLASESRTLSGDELASATSFSPETVRWIFLRGESDGRCTENEMEQWIVVECGDESGAPRYRGYVQPDLRLLRREELLEAGRPRLTVEYAEHRATAGVRLPYSIVWTEAAPETRVVIDIDAYEVNVDLSPALFVPPA